MLPRLFKMDAVITSRFWMMPALFLKKMVMGNFEKGLVDPEIADSVDFLVEKVRTNQLERVVGIDCKGEVSMQMHS